MRLAGLAPELRPYVKELLDLAAAEGVPVTITSVRRSTAEQAALYRKWQRGESRFPAAPPGRSGHEHGLAWDSWVPQQHQAWWVAQRKAQGWWVPAGDWIHAEALLAG